MKNTGIQETIFKEANYIQSNFINSASNCIRHACTWDTFFCPISWQFITVPSHGNLLLSHPMEFRSKDIYFILHV